MSFQESSYPSLFIPNGLVWSANSAQDGADGPRGGAVFVASPGVRGVLPTPFAW